MTDKRVIPERRAENKAVLIDLQAKMDAVHDRVYNGLGKELRQEIKTEVGAVRSLVIGILVALILALAGIVVEGRVSAGQASTENNRNYQAIVDIGSRLDNHIILTKDKP